MVEVRVTAPLFSDGRYSLTWFASCQNVYIAE